MSRTMLSADEIDAIQHDVEAQALFRPAWQDAADCAADQEREAWGRFLDLSETRRVFGDAEAGAHR